MTNTLRYDAYGRLLAGAPQQDRVFAYNGEQYTPQTGLQYLRARHYGPQLGAFTTRDTYLGDLKTPISQNRYTYAHNNPVRYVDPSGHRLDVDGPRGPGTTSPGNIRDSYKPAPSRPAPSGGAQVIGGIAAAATGAGAAVGVPMILKGAAKIAVGALVLAAAVQGEETKESIPQAPIEDSKDYLILLKALITGTIIQTMSAQ